MSDKKQMKEALVIALVVAGITLAGVLVGSLIGGRGAGGTQPAAQITEQTENEAGEAEELIAGQSDARIKIPGFDAMTLQAGTYTQQCDLLYNPEVNDCYFVVTLSLPDGTPFFQSGPLAPGRRLEVLELSRKLTAGTYEDAVLQYDCFAVDSGEQLNGATVKFKLEVIP